jgi:hypothetical protein
MDPAPEMQKAEEVLGATEEQLEREPERGDAQGHSF